jgi:phage virion morphogenesis protein
MSDALSLSFDDAAFQRAMGELAARGTRLKPLLYELAFELERSTKDRFDREEDPDGVPWVDLRPATWARKRSSKKLEERGFLKGGIGVGDVTDEYADVVADREYAAIHQEGGTPDMAPGPAAIPARPYMGVSRDDADMILRAAQAYLEDALR